MFQSMLSSMMSQISEIHSRQNQFERELSAIKGSEIHSIDQSSAIIKAGIIKAGMKPAEVSHLSRRHM